MGLLLQKEGWLLLARNFRTKRGEIDLVAEKGGVLAFVEVKLWRRNGSGDLANSIDRRKKKRIIETSKIFLAKYRQYNGERVRYDVFLLSPGQEPMRYEGAFDETV